MECPRCGQYSREGELVCMHCGYVERPNATVTLTGDPSRLRLRKTQTITTTQVSTGSIILRIRGMMEQLDMRSINNLVLGRSDHEHGFAPGVDLSAYGAADRGVSRAHATLTYQNSQLTVVDLNSSNGTLLNGERLVPERPYMLKDGDELILGRLPIAVSFWNA
jgi:hypothetical protein